MYYAERLELYNLYSSPHIIRVIKPRKIDGRTRSMHGRDEKFIKILVGKPEGKTTRGRTTCRWEDNIKMHLGEIGRQSVDWIHPDQDRDQ
jgi:hypothetical protein